jgi:hypothetical protein
MALKWKRDREAAILTALLPLLDSRYGPLRFDHRPDDVIPPDRQQRRAPDALYVGESGSNVMVEVTELSRKEPLEYSRVKARRAEAVGDFSKNTYPIYNDAATVKEAVIKYLGETDDKFGYRSGAVGILALDTASYVWGPILLRNLIRDLDFTSWPRVSDVWIVVDEPYGELPADDSGHVSGAYRVWFARTPSGGGAEDRSR